MVGLQRDQEHMHPCTSIRLGFGCTNCLQIGLIFIVWSHGWKKLQACEQDYMPGHINELAKDTKREIETLKRIIDESNIWPISEAISLPGMSVTFRVYILAGRAPCSPPYECYLGIACKDKPDFTFGFPQM